MKKLSLIAALIVSSNSFAYDNVTLTAKAITGDCYHKHGCVAQGWVEADVENVTNQDHTYYIGYSIDIGDIVSPNFYTDYPVVKAHEKYHIHHDLKINAEHLDDDTLYFVQTHIQAKDQTDKLSTLYTAGDYAKYKMH